MLTSPLRPTAGPARNADLAAATDGLNAVAADQDNRIVHDAPVFCVNQAGCPHDMNCGGLLRSRRKPQAKQDTRQDQEFHNSPRDRVSLAPVREL